MAGDTPETGYVEVQGGRLYYERTGRGPNLVLIHAAIADRRMWDREFARWADRRTVVRYDVRGLGKSTAAEQPYSDSDDLRRLLDHLAIDRTDVIGCSNGGRIALDLALVAPHRAGKLVLVAPSVGGFEPSEEPEEHQAFHRVAERMGEIFAAIKANDTARALDLIQKLWCSAQTGAGLALVRKMLADNATEVLTDATANRSVPLDPPAVGRLGTIASSALVIEGGRDAEGMHYVCDRIVHGIPRAKLQLIPGADHLVNLSQPDAFDAAVWGHLG